MTITHILKVNTWRAQNGVHQWEFLPTSILLMQFCLQLKVTGMQCFTASEQVQMHHTSHGFSRPAECSTFSLHEQATSKLILNPTKNKWLASVAWNAELQYTNLMSIILLIGNEAKPYLSDEQTIYHAKCWSTLVCNASGLWALCWLTVEPLFMVTQNRWRIEVLVFP